MSLVFFCKSFQYTIFVLRHGYFIIIVYVYNLCYFVNHYDVQFKEKQMNFLSISTIQLVIEFVFSFGMFINALLFIPQAIKIYKLKNSCGLSLITFIGFFLTQLTIVLHGFLHHDSLLAYGYMLSMLTCGIVIFLMIIYRK